MNEKSYTELMKNSAMKRKKLKEAFVLDLYIDMVLTEILLNTEKEKIMKKINQALDEGNKPEFLILSRQYKELIQRFGN